MATRSRDIRKARAAAEQSKYVAWHIGAEVRYNAATHWMPLPTPPAPTQEPAAIASTGSTTQATAREALEELVAVADQNTLLSCSRDPGRLLRALQAARAVLAATEEQAGEPKYRCTVITDQGTMSLEEWQGKPVPAWWLAQVKEPAPAAGHTPEPVALWQYRWTNPGNLEHQGADATAWNEVKTTSLLQSLEEKIQELRAYRYMDLPCYEVRALYTSPNVPASQAQGAGSQPTGAVPAGWKLVPFEPTEEMLHAYATAWFNYEIKGLTLGQRGAHEYRSMLAAAPTDAGQMEQRG